MNADDPHDGLAVKVETLASAIGALMDDRGFASPHHVPLSDPREVKTGTGVLATDPVEPGAIRGIDGVMAQLSLERADPDSREHVVADLLYTDGTIRTGLLTDMSSLGPLVESFKTARAAVIDHIAGDKCLRARFEVNLGGRPPDGVDEDDYYAGLDAINRSFLVLPILVDRFRTATRTDPGQDEPTWQEIGARVATDLLEMRVRETERFCLRAFLDSPPLDTSPCDLGAHDFGGLRIHLRMISVTDAMIAEAAQETVGALPVGLRTTNTAVEVEFSQAVNMQAEASSAGVQRALEAAQRVVDVLRVHRTEDLGIGYAHVLSRQWGARALSKAPLWGLQETSAVFIPRRAAFATANAKRLISEHVEAVARHVERHLEGVSSPGFAVAIRRFRDTYERYWPRDPEMLLDATIALEALFLGDPYDRELRYRLSLRVARLLAADLDTRTRLAKAVRAAYDLRSKIAHGATVDSMKPRDAEKLAKVLDEIPAILRAAIGVFLDGKGPDVKGDALAEWWSNVELG